MTATKLTPRIEALLQRIEEAAASDDMASWDSDPIREAVAELRERLGGDGERDFEVGWAMPVTASNPIAAALLARDIHQDPANIATIYTVTDLNGATRYVIDLDPDNNGGPLIMHQESLT
ncbi:MAG TPA: hypothetical protein VGJ60_07315 [Chloroflexota bacterium]|jgi:hypothetical protein